MFGFLSNIYTMINSIIDWAIASIQSVIHFFGYLITSTVYLYEAIVFLPPILKAAAAAVIIIAIFHLITLSS